MADIFEDDFIDFSYSTVGGAITANITPFSHNVVPNTSNDGSTINYTYTFAQAYIITNSPFDSRASGVISGMGDAFTIPVDEDIEFQVKATLSKQNYKVLGTEFFTGLPSEEGQNTGDFTYPVFDYISEDTGGNFQFIYPVCSVRNQHVVNQTARDNIVIDKVQFKQLGGTGASVNGEGGVAHIIQESGRENPNLPIRLRAISGGSGIQVRYESADPTGDFYHSGDGGLIIIDSSAGGGGVSNFVANTGDSVTGARIYVTGTNFPQYLRSLKGAEQHDYTQFSEIYVYELDNEIVLSGQITGLWTGASVGTAGKSIYIEDTGPTDTPTPSKAQFKKIQSSDSSITVGETTGTVDIKTTLQSTTDGGSTTDNNMNLDGSSLTFDNDVNKSLKGGTERVILGSTVKTISSAQSDVVSFFPDNSAAICTMDYSINATSPATGAVIIGGTGNRISGHYNVITAGVFNKISGKDFNFIGGGSGNDVNFAQFSSSLGGKNNDITGANYSVLLGGDQNLIKTGHAHFLGGGVSNKISGSASIISNALVGGTQNKILDATYSFIGAGATNTVYSNNSVIGGGTQNIVSGDSSVVFGGSNNQVLANYGVAAGRNSIVSGDHSGAFVLSDAYPTNTFSSGANTLTLNFKSGVYVDSDSGIYINGNPVMTGSSDLDTDTLQTVTDRGSSTTNAITGAGFFIKDGSTQIGQLSKDISTSNFVIKSSVNNADLEFKGVDDSANITALKLDMSDAGSAIFNHNIELPSAGEIGWDAGDVKFVHSSNALTFQGATNGLKITADGSNATALVESADGNFKIDTVLDLTLDAGGGDIILSDDATIVGTLSLGQNGGDFEIRSRVSDKDLVFKGNDGGSEITALTIDMSEGGRVGIGTTNPSDFVGGGNNLVVGDGSAAQGMSIFAGSSHSASLYFAKGTVGADAYRGWVQYRIGDDRLDFGAGGGRRMSLNGNGLAIGDITSPSAELEISSSLPAIRLTDSDGTNQFSEIERAGTSLNFYARDNASNGRFVFLGDNGTSDTEFMRIETDGNVEIGDNKKFKASTYSSSYIKFEDDTKVSANSDIIFDVNGSTELMRLEEGGNVGIGTTTPRTSLHVSKAGTTEGGILTIANPNTTDGSYCGIEFINSTFDYPRSAIFAMRTGGSYDADLTFHTSKLNEITGTDYPTATERMRITCSGRVGIGTDDPAFELDVSGTIHGTSGNFENGITIDGNPVVTGTSAEDSDTLQTVTTRGNSTTNNIIINNAGSDPDYGALTITGGYALAHLRSTGTVAYLQFQNSSTNYGSMSNDGLTVGMNGLDGYITNREAQELYLGTSGEARMAIRRDGKVGIGTLTPSEQLHVYGGDVKISDGTPVLTLHDTSSSALTTLTLDGVNTTLNNAGSNGSLIFSTESTEAMRIDEDGNVGIGTNNPTELLEVDGNIRLGDGGVRDIIGPTNESLRILANPNASTEGIIFSTDGGTTNEMFIQDGGNVGIGLADPDQKLDVNGNIRIPNQGKIVFGSAGTASDYLQLYDVGAGNPLLKLVQDGAERFSIEGVNGNVYMQGDVGIGIAGPQSKLHVSAGDIRIDNNQQYLAETAGGGVIGVAKMDGSDNLLIGDGNFVIDVNGSSERMRIDSNGNVGIGTTNPSNALDVVGHFSATSKSFLIDHPTKENKKLQYASLEGPENGVYVRGTTDEETIELPEYWSELVHDESITVVLTPIGKKQDLFIIKKSNKLIKIGGVEGSYDYVVYGERKDIDRLEVEPDGN